MAEQLAGGGVDERDGVGAIRHLVAIPVRPRADRDAAHRMPGDHRPLAGAKRRIQDGLQVAGQVVEAVVVPVARDLAAAVAAVVERDHAVVFGEVGDLVLPYAQGAGDAMAEHDRVAVVGPEDFGVQPSAVRGTHHDRAAFGQVHIPVRGPGAPCALSLQSHECSDHRGFVAAEQILPFCSARKRQLGANSRLR